MNHISANGGHHGRMHGLDICRTIAILPVVFGHMLAYSTPHPAVQSLGFLAIFGVDIFFCLSGFLIGKILLADTRNWHESREDGVVTFWYRRWMRTLPLYFFYLYIELLLYWGGKSSLWSQLRYVFFAQNLAWPMTDFYRVTWSLAIEEWFYFLFPILVLLIILTGKPSRIAVRNASILFIALPFVLRLVLFGKFNFSQLDPGIRHVVIFRLDSIGFGILFAYLSIYKEALFDSAKRYSLLFFALVLLCIFYIKFGYFGLGESGILAAIYFTIVALAFAGLLPFFCSLKPSRFTPLNHFVSYTSLISYSMYLGHTPAFYITKVMLRKSNLYDVIQPNPWLMYPILTVMVYLVASLTYFLVERPFLRLRDTLGRAEKKNHVPLQVG